jgi:dTDP-4-dehydrorhamnose reductase
MQTVLLTGANGFIGQYLAERLLKKGFNVIATGRGDNRLPFTNDHLQYASLDFTDRAAVDELLKLHQPHFVVHAGALSKPDECELNKEAAFLVNVTGTQNVLQAAQQCKSFFIYLSTDFVFEGTKLDYSEEDSLQPVNYYGKTKKEAEAVVQHYPFGWSIVRTILVYGHPRQGRQNLLTFVANGLQEGRTLKIVDDQVRQPTYVEDLVWGIAALIDKKAAGIFHFSGNDVTTPYQMACAVADYKGFDKSGIQKVTAASFNEPARRPRTTGFNLAKAERLLGYKPISFAEGLKKTFEESDAE